MRAGRHHPFAGGCHGHISLSTGVIGGRSDSEAHTENHIFQKKTWRRPALSGKGRTRREILSHLADFCQEKIMVEHRDLVAYSARPMVILDD